MQLLALSVVDIPSAISVLWPFWASVARFWLLGKVSWCKFILFKLAAVNWHITGFFWVASKSTSPDP